MTGATPNSNGRRLMTDIATSAVPPLIKSVVIPCSVSIAFTLFTEHLAEWWPLGRFHAAPNPRDCGVEPWVGGRVYERGADGSLIEWGRVIAWQRPQRCSFTWWLGVDASQAQLLTVAFANVEGGTRVKLMHTGWQKLGAAAHTRRDQTDDDWNIVFNTCYREYAERYADAQPAATADDDLGTTT